jgi:hypothetical protein
MASLPKVFIRSIKETTSEEDTMQQNQGEMEFKNAIMEFNVDAKQEAHNWHYFH